MLENYEYESLLIGNLTTLTNQGFGLQNIEEGPYIFYKEKNSEEYVEIFTEEKYRMTEEPSKATSGRIYKRSKEESNTIGKTYVRQIDDIKNYLSEEELLELEKEIKRVELELEQNPNKKVKVEFSIGKKRLLQIYRNMVENYTRESDRQQKQLRKFEEQYGLTNTRK